MNIEMFPDRKPRSDSALKSFSQNVQDEIVQYAQGRSLREVQAWLQEKHHVKRALSTISEFLSWSRTIERRYGNQGAIEALVTPLGSDGPESTDTPELTEEEIRIHARRYFLETIVHDCNIPAWHQSERIALGREELELKRQQLELKREELELKRKIHERRHVEYIVNTCNNPKVRAVAQDEDKSYEEKVTGINKIIFGDSGSRDTTVTSKPKAEDGVENGELLSAIHPPSPESAAVAQDPAPQAIAVERAWGLVREGATNRENWSVRKFDFNMTPDGNVSRVLTEAATGRGPQAGYSPWSWRGQTTPVG